MPLATKEDLLRRLEDDAQDNVDAKLLRLRLEVAKVPGPTLRRSMRGGYGTQIPSQLDSTQTREVQQCPDCSHACLTRARILVGQINARVHFS